MEKKKGKNLRSWKNYLINPQEQIRYVLLCFFMLFVGVGVHTAFVLKSLNVLGTGDELANAIFLSKVMKISFISLCVVSLVGGALFSILNVMYTHRTFGSLHAVGLHLKKMLNGEKVGPLILRQKDEDVSEIVSTLNKIIEKQSGQNNETAEIRKIAQ